MPIMMASSLSATFICRKPPNICRNLPKDRRRWSPCMAAAGSPARAAPFNIGVRISPRAASRYLPSPIGSRLVGVYGVYDLYAIWCSLQVQDGRNSDNKVEKFIGAPPMANRQLYFDASPISYATYANNAVGVLLATGTEDDLVDRRTQTEPFQLTLKQAGFFVRPCIVPGAPHYWMNDPIEERGSLSGFLAPRLTRFLAERL